MADSLLAFFRWDATTAPWYRVPGELEARPGPPSAGVALAAAPNPSRAGMVFRLRAPAGTPWRLAVMDAFGRPVHSATGAGTGSDQQVAWPGTLARGGPAPPGSYWARLEAAGERIVLRLVSLRQGN